MFCNFKLMCFDCDQSDQTSNSDLNEFGSMQQTLSLSGLDFDK